MKGAASNSIIRKSLTFRQMKDNFQKVLAAIGIDVLFLFVYGLVTAPIVAKLVDYILIMGGIIGENVSKIDPLTASAEEMSMTLLGPELNPYVWKFLLLVFILIAAVFLVYSLFQGTSWYLCSRIAGKKKDYFKYMNQFIVVTIPWYVLFVAYNIFMYISNVAAGMAETFETGTKVIHPVVPFIIMLAVLYFAFISYSLVKRYRIGGLLKKTFVIGVKKADTVLLSFIIIFIVFFVLDFLLSLLTSRTLIILVGILVAMPAYVWARLFFINTVEKATK